MNKHFASSDMEEPSQTNEMSFPESGKVQQQPKSNFYSRSSIVTEAHTCRDRDSIGPELISFEIETLLGHLKNSIVSESFLKRTVKELRLDINRL